ncbi:glycoside hydrolase family 18 protein [Acidobacteria bacterium AB60]|nr:glycoside hydrolase family 18 protein [Acidobacteria bacterium AB60]
MSRFLLLLFACSLALQLPAAPLPQSKLIVAYVFPQNALLQPGQIDPHAITRINYAFADIQSGRVVLGNANDPANLAVLTGLRRDNPSLTVLISVGGWLGSAGFSDAARTLESRRQFIESAVAFIRTYRLDGLDIDWEYPGMPGAGHPFLPEDGRNFELLCRELRAAFNKEQTANRRLYLTIAAGASEEFLAHTPMAELQSSLDTVNLMAYDYYEPGSGTITGNHAPLFTDPADPNKVSADDSVRVFQKAGVPPRKLILGVPFYGHMWGEVAGQDHGLFQPGKPIPHAYAPFSLIQSSMLNQGFTRFWDAVSRVPWLYNPASRVFVSYEDPQSLTEKSRYIRAHNLGGVMFWNYANDDASGTLLKTLDTELLAPRPSKR